MYRRLACLLLVVAGSVCGSALAFPSLSRVDNLPKGASGRFGIVEPRDRSAIKTLVFAPNGKQLISVDASPTARVWEIATGNLIHAKALDKNTGVWALAPNGKILYAIDERLTVHRYSLTDTSTTTIELQAAKKLEIGLQPREAHVIPNGALALLCWPKAPELRLHRYSFSYWDVSTGELIRWGGDPGNDYRSDYMRMSPDGRYVAGPEAAYETRKGNKLIVPSNPFGTGGAPIFSPDGRFLAAASRDTRVTELATGRSVVDLPITSLEHAAFSHDGRRLAVALADRIAVWDLTTRKAIVEWPTASQVGPIAFSLDGRTLATGHADGTILTWPIPGTAPDGRWSEVDANAAWDLLIDENSINAYPAVWQFMDFPAEAVQFLRNKFALGALTLPEQWGKLIADLDSPRFAIREAASKRIRGLGHAADSPLRDALKHAPSPEQFARIEALLAGLEPAARPRGEDLRATRAVAILEACGTDEARRLIADWAEKGSLPRLAEEACQALGRIKNR